MTDRSVTFEVRRDALAAARVVEAPLGTLADGQALLAVERFGLTANNITYALLGDELGYWRFFAAEPGWGRILVWGFAEVVATATDVLSVGERVFGYCPMSSHMLLTPRPGGAGLVDAAEHRASLPRAYNAYRKPGTDPGSDPERESEQLLLRPLFLLSFLVDDFLADESLFGAERVVVSSASSKTALGLAFLLSTRGARVVGLTSARNAAFVARVGVYEEVVTYDRLETLPRSPAVYVDLAGDRQLRRRVHEHLAEGLRHSALVGATHRDEDGFARGTPMPGPEPSLFFVPDRLRGRTRDWGQAELDARLGAAFNRFTGWTDTWLSIEHAAGPEATAAVYRQVLDGAVAPDVAHTLSLDLKLP